MGGAALHPLQHARQLSRRMHAHHHVDMRRDDPERQHATTLLTHDDRYVLREERSTNAVQGWFPISGGPDHMDDETMVHGATSGVGLPTHGSRQRTGCRFSDISRAVASATSMR